MKICEAFALKHKLVFGDEGEVGFGRECVGFKHGDSYVDYNPLTNNYTDYVHEYDSRLVPPENTPDAYHKHDCLVVLGRGEKAVSQLARWVESLESHGEVYIDQYETGHKDFINITFHGLTKMCKD